jgi:putative ABC transport system permease protein
VLYDRRSRPIFGSIEAGKDVTLDAKSFHVGGFVDIGPDIVNDGAMVMSDGSYLAQNPTVKPIMGAVRLAPGTDKERIKRQIAEQLPKDISVFTPQEVRSREVAFTLRSAPIGILFGIGMLAGLVIGSITCYQILFNEIMDRIKQYAMLKAMGFSDGFLRRIILEQAILLSCGGFVFGIGVAWLVYTYVAGETLLAVQMSIFSGASVFVLATVMSIVAGLFALRRVATADPAELY